MKALKINIILFTVLSIFNVTLCTKNPTIPNAVFIEPEMIVIDDNLLYTYGATWDTSFHPPDSLKSSAVELEPFEIGKYELTNAEYEKFVQDGGYDKPDFWSPEGWEFKNDLNWSMPAFWSKDRLWKDDPYSKYGDTPVHGISYYEAEAFCNWLSKKANENYHIPTSYQWTRAAKGPDPGKKYTWGNDYHADFAHFFCPFSDVPLEKVHEYGEGKSHEGCYNMIGNVFEVCRITHFVSSSNLSFYYSLPSLSVSGGGDPCFRTMTTTSGWSSEKSDRYFAYGLRVAKSIR